MSDTVFEANFQPWVTVSFREGGEISVEIDWYDSAQGEWIDGESEHDESTVGSEMACAFLDAVVQTEPTLVHPSFDVGRVAHQVEGEVARLNSIIEADREGVVLGGNLYLASHLEHRERELASHRLLLTILREQ